MKSSEQTAFIIIMFFTVRTMRFSSFYPDGIAFIVRIPPARNENIMITRIAHLNNDSPGLLRKIAILIILLENIFPYNYNEIYPFKWFRLRIPVDNY